MYKIIKKILIATVIFIALDLAFMSINKKLFTSTIINIQRVMVMPKYIAFIPVYILLISALYWFILRQRRPIWEAILLGIVINGVYEGTNYSIFKKWSLKMVITDTLWGGALFGLTTAAVYQLV